MKIEYLTLEEIKPYENNPRNNRQAIEAVKNSIAAFGFKQPIVTDKNGVIIVGHTRWQAAKELGLPDIPVLIAKDLTEEQAAAYRLADNKTNELAEWDFEKLEQEILNIKNIDLNLFGFDIFKDPDQEALDNIDECEAEDADGIKTDIKVGDVFSLGKHLLICGDSTKPEIIKELTKDGQADLLLTDPPYNVAYVGHKKVREKIKNDKMPTQKYIDFLTAAFKNAFNNMKQGAPFYIWHAQATYKENREAIERAGEEIRQQLIWVKTNLVLGRLDYHYKHEPCIYGWKQGAPHYFTDSRTETTVIDDTINVNKLNKQQLKELCEKLLTEKKATDVIHYSKPINSEEHPTMKPVGLFAYLMRNSSKPGGIILDIFGGSGTTTIAAEQLNREARSAELSPQYCQVIINRFKKLTGTDAEYIKNIYEL